MVGVLHGSSVLLTFNTDQSLREFPEGSQTERTCHSYAVPGIKFDFVCELLYIGVMLSQAVSPAALNLKS